MIKVLLVLALGVGLALMVSGPSARRLASRRLMGIAVAGLGVVAVIWPDVTTRAAHLVGVGRGTDLVLYVAVLAFAFLSIAVYERIARLESQISTLSRELALRDAPAEEQRAA